MITPDQLDIEILLKAHDHYMDVESLTKTSQWLEDEYNIRYNRFKLSKQFHQNELYVAPPNGKPELAYYQEVTYLDEWNELLGSAIQLAWEDILEFLNGDGSLLNYMTACWFISSPLYSTFLDRLKNNADSNIDENSLPDNVTREDIAKGKEMYERRLKYWVLTDGD